MSDQAAQTAWDAERSALLGRKISELGLGIRGTRVERLVTQLYEELGAKGVAFRPPVYLSDQWGCRGTLIRVPFHLVDQAQAHQAEMSAGVRTTARRCAHAPRAGRDQLRVLSLTGEWRTAFGSFTKPYRERYRANPFSREYVRHILGWYAQKHPDEDFAETFAVWLTPELDWRRQYAGWPALSKLEYVDRVMREIGPLVPEVPPPTEDDLPVEAMHYTVAEHYAESEEPVPIEDERQFDTDLRGIFVSDADAPGGEPAQWFVQRHYREIVSRISYWTSEAPSVVRSFVDHLARRTAALELKVGGLEASTLIELTAFGTAVVMNHRCTHTLGRTSRGTRGNHAATA